MNKKKIIGIIFILVAVIIAVLSILKPVHNNDKGNETTVDETITNIVTTTAIPESTSEVVAETVTIDIYHEEHSDEYPVEIRLPKEDVLNFIDNDTDGLIREVKTFINGYGYGDAKYAEFTGDIEMNTNEHLVTLTYYLKWKRREIKYFYLIYNTNTKEWSSRQA